MTTYYDGFDPFASLVKKTMLNADDLKPFMVAEEIQAKVVDVAEFRSELLEMLENPPQVSGAKLPWGSTHGNLRFRPGEMTIWAGINGHGKSQLLGMASIGWVTQGEKVLNMSFEMKPTSTLFRMLCQGAMNGKPSKQFADTFINFLMGNYFIFDHQGSAKPDMVFAAIRYAASKGIKHVIVDSLMVCVKGTDDYNGQKDFINEASQLAKQHNVHVHIVHHIRKQENELKVPGKFDLQGSGAISDLADQVLVVYRNKSKEKRLVEKPDDAEILKEPDAILSCDKNRHGEWEGRVPLWFIPACKQYVSDSRLIAVNLLNNETYNYRML
jgi:twinkle protein